MSKENLKITETPVDRRQIELESQAAQAKAARAAISWMARAAVRLFNAPTTVFEGAEGKGVSVGRSYRKRLRTMKRDSVSTSTF
ncbi:hypothetical protein [Tropicimonas sediminicola]|uniref:Uncharacterized protein n=1 Tax=Tropicimonas sediminicola TaxID=1031541 RepID=A0A239ICA2_9RHOB|nr:hypothetical protein [Tropicimonas sediminicola]SNS91175.1 hypothetical protein SAMN05421757_104324 [Tropicimonas sediminicola]